MNLFEQMKSTLTKIYIKLHFVLLKTVKEKAINLVFSKNKMRLTLKILLMSLRMINVAHTY